MGAITRAAANNITTGGIILPAGINDASVASIDALANISAGDGITLISSQTASASGSVNFTSGIDSTYRTYMFKFINIHSSFDGDDFLFNLSTDGGSNYNVTKTTTAFYAYHDEADANTALTYNTGADLAQSTAAQILIPSVGTDNDQASSGTLYLFNPSSTTYVKHFMSNLNTYTYPDYSSNFYVAGYGNTTSAINAIRFQFSAGDVDAGTIHMYGVA
jgi:hypothetical protein